LILLAASVNGSEEQRDCEEEESKGPVPILPDISIVTSVFTVLYSGNNSNDDCYDERDNSQHVHNPADTPSAVFILMSHTHDDVFVYQEIIRFFFR